MLPSRAVTLAQRFDRAITLAAVFLLIMTMAVVLYWVKKRPDAHARANVVVGKRVVIDETGGAAHVEYILTVEAAPGRRSEAVVPADVYQRAALGSRVERRQGTWIVMPR
ncbi:MAG TPA: hypothetical protein VJ276_17570 [Thermoanaerobaculia bacterium]|nr:hypothetical protein [Thermoanaerobaculia bacterium]